MGGRHELGQRLDWAVAAIRPTTQARITLIALDVYEDGLAQSACLVFNEHYILQ